MGITANGTITGTPDYAVTITGTDGTKEVSDNFIAIINRPDGTSGIFYNTDALSMGMGIKMMCRAYMDCISQCTPEEQKQVTKMLGLTTLIQNLADNVEKLHEELA